MMSSHLKALQGLRNHWWSQMRDRPIFNGHLELELSGLGPCTRPGDSETTGDETRTFPRYLISYGDEAR